MNKHEMVCTFESEQLRILECPICGKIKVWMFSPLKIRTLVEGERLVEHVWSRNLEIAKVAIPVEEEVPEAFRKAIEELDF